MSPKWFPLVIRCPDSGFWSGSGSEVVIYTQQGTPDYQRISIPSNLWGMISSDTTTITAETFTAIWNSEEYNCGDWSLF